MSTDIIEDKSFFVCPNCETGRVAEGAEAVLDPRKGAAILVCAICVPQFDLSDKTKELLDNYHPTLLPHTNGNGNGH